MKMYSKPLFSEFGFKRDETQEFRYQLEENMNYGRACESGLAVIKDGNKMMCVEIDSIMTNIDNYAEPQPKAAKCRLVLD